MNRIFVLIFIAIFGFQIISSFGQPNIIITNQKANSDPSIISSLHLSDIYNYTKGENVKVAVIDTGISSLLENNIYHNNIEMSGKTGVEDDNNSYIDEIRGWNVYDDNNNTYDWSTTEHGTEVASMIVQYAPNVKLIPIKFIDQNNVIEDYNLLLKLVDALNYAEVIGANIVVMAFNYFISTSTITSLANKFTELKNKGIVLLASAGNCVGGSSCDYIKEPALDPNVWAIGSVNSHNIQSSFSSGGAGLDFVVYGENDQVLNDYGTTSVNGTSFSVGLFASIVSLFKSVYPNLSVDQIYNYLKNTALNLGNQNEYGYGLPMLSYAMNSVYDTIAPILIDYTTQLTDSYTYIINLNLQEDNALSNCSYFLKNMIKNELVINNLTCNTNNYFPILSQSGKVLVSVVVQPFSEFQVNLTLTDSNYNTNDLSFDFKTDLTTTGGQPNTQTISYNSTQSNYSYIQNPNSEYVSSGKGSSIPKYSSSQTSTAHNLDFPSIGISFLVFLIVLINRKRSFDKN